MTSGSAQSNFRPVSPRQLRGGDLQVVWMHGSYPGFTTFQTSLTSLLSHAFTTLRVSAAPATISYGQSVRVGGRLLRSDTRALLAGRQVEVYGRRKGTTAWALLARRTTDGAGAITYDRRVGGTAELQLRFRGSDDLAPSTSPVITVTVVPNPTRLGASATPSTLVRGATTLITGRLQRYGGALGGQPVEFYGRRKGTTAWSLLARRTTGPDGIARYARAPGGTAEFQVRYRGSAAWARASSPIITVTVR